MWVSYDNLWVCYVGSVGLILLLYAVKAIVLRHFREPAQAGAVFAVVAALCVPATWALSPDWDNWHVLRIGIYIGSPVATLTVPCVSFVIDLARRSAEKQGRWYWRLPLEMFIAVPVWFCFWVFFELLVLGWVWI